MASEQSHPPDPAAAMLETVRLLFPEAEVRFGRPDRSAMYDFRFFPSVTRPNLVVPGMSLRASARTAWRFSAATGLRETATRALAGSALRLGAAKAARDSIAVGACSDSIVDHLDGIFGRPITISIAIGSERANRKPVLEAFDDQGESLGFVKVGVDAVSRTDVGAEAINLRSIAGHVPRRLCVPQVLEASEWRGNVVLVMSSLPTRWQRPRVRRHVPLDEMYEFSRAWGSEREPFAHTEFWRQLRRRVVRLVPGRSTERLQTALDQLEDEVGAVLVEAGAWHGDWTPWNMAWRNGRLQLWDFERFDRAGLVGLDVVHYAVNETMQRSGVTHTQLAQALSESEHLLSQVIQAPRIIGIAYLAAIALRYRVAAGSLRGELIADRTDFMIEALERRISDT